MPLRQRSGVPVGVSIARASRAAQGRLDDAYRRRCRLGSELANAEGSRRSNQKLILEALADTRAALKEIQRADLGSQYQLQLEVSDWEGWPRLELRLIDCLAEFVPGYRGTVEEQLSSGAVERASGGMVFLALNYREVLARISIDDHEQLDSLSQSIIDAVQVFLSRVVQRSCAAPTPEPTPLKNPAPPPLCAQASPLEPPKTPPLTSDAEVADRLLAIDFLAR